MLLVEPRCLERGAPAPVRQRQPGRGPDVVGRHRIAAGPGRQRDRCLRGDQVGPQPVDVERRAQGGDLAQGVVTQHDGRQPLPGQDDLCCQRGVRLGVHRGEAGWVGLVGQPAADDVGPFGRFAGRRDLDRQSEPVEQLRPQLALLRVHRADQQEPRRVPDRHAFPLDVRRPEGGRVEQ